MRRWRLRRLPGDVRRVLQRLQLHRACGVPLLRRRRGELQHVRRRARRWMPGRGVRVRVGPSLRRRPGVCRRKLRVQRQLLWDRLLHPRRLLRRGLDGLALRNERGGMLRLWRLRELRRDRVRTSRLSRQLQPVWRNRLLQRRLSAHGRMRSQLRELRLRARLRRERAVCRELRRGRSVSSRLRRTELHNDLRRRQL